MAAKTTSDSPSHSLETIEKDLAIFGDQLQEDRKDFQRKFDGTRRELFDYLDRSIKELNRLKEKYREEFDYLERENENTCEDNLFQYEQILSKIRRATSRPNVLARDLENFRRNFPHRPKMIDDLPQFDFQPIPFDQFIKKRTQHRANVCPASKGVEQKDSTSEAPTNETTFQPIRSATTTDENHPDRQSISDETSSNANESEPQPRLISSASTFSYSPSQVNILFKIPHEHLLTPFFLAHDPTENTLLLYSNKARRFEHVFLSRHRVEFIPDQWKGELLHLDYSVSKKAFYSIEKRSGELVFFRVDRKAIVLIETIDLTEENLLLGHIHDDQLYVLSGRSLGPFRFGTYQLDNSTPVSTRPLRHFRRDEKELTAFSIVDFTVHQPNVVFLVELQKRKDYVVYITDHQLNGIRSFDLIDAKYPLSMISTNRNKHCLIYINDIDGHLIHCCNEENYLTSIEINAYGITSLSDGNVALIGRKDIRGLKVMDQLFTNQSI